MKAETNIQTLACTDANQRRRIIRCHAGNSSNFGFSLKWVELPRSTSVLSASWTIFDSHGRPRESKASPLQGNQLPDVDHRQFFTRQANPTIKTAGSNPDRFLFFDSNPRQSVFAFCRSACHCRVNGRLSIRFRFGQVTIFNS